MAGRILIADDVATNRIVLKVKLAAAHYRVGQCASAAEALEQARNQAADLILIPQNLPDMSGADLCRRLKSDPATATIPVLMLVRPGRSDGRLAALASGADEVLTLPCEEIGLLARVRSMLRAHETDSELRRRDLTARDLGFGASGFAEPAASLPRPGRIALIGETPEQALAWKNALRRVSPTPPSLMSRAEALALESADRAPDLFCIAAAGGDGLRLLSELRSRSATRHTAVLTIHPRGQPEAQATALDLGANGVLEDGFDPAELALRIGREIARKRNADRLRMAVEDGLRMATVDPLTGLFNRRYGEHHLAALARRAVATQRTFGLLMIDIDRFKTVNDTWGHAIGDMVLRRVARTIRDNLRAVDLVARHGGEEFVVALPDAALPAARHAAERIRRVIAQSEIAAPDGSRLPVTVSIGLAMGGPEGQGVTALMEQADRALYQAKAAGRDRVCVAASSAVEGSAPEEAAPSGGKTAPAPAQRRGGSLRGPLRNDRSSRSA